MKDKGEGAGILKNETGCSTDCLCAYCDPKPGCKNEECHRHCTGEDRLVSHCDDFVVWRGAA